MSKLLNIPELHRVNLNSFRMSKTMYMTGDNPEDPPEGLLGDPERESRTVYVGNISPDTAYERMKEVLKEVGTVVSFKMVFDRELSVLKTYGFAEYKVRYRSN